MTNHKIKVLIVDDSVIIQKLLKNFLSREPDFEVVGVCADPFEASEFLTGNKVDCMVLDLEMPKMDGVTFLKKVTESCSVQTIILSGLVDSDPTLRGKLISIGAFDAFAKPQSSSVEFFPQLAASIRKSCKVSFPVSSETKTAKHQIKDLLLIASSTGGTDGVRKIVQALGPNPPTVLIIQHMAAVFTKKFATSLNLVAQFEIEEVNDHSLLEVGKGYVAPGNYHVRIIGHKNSTYSLELNQENHIHAVRPSADHTFLNIPKSLIRSCTVLVITGMGKDGAAGLAHLKKSGAKTIAESEISAVVFGMPKAAIDTGCVDTVLTLPEICEYLASKYNKEKAS